MKLEHAILCLDCEWLRDMRELHCPACGSQASMSVANVLGQIRTDTLNKAVAACTKTFEFTLSRRGEPKR